MVLRACSGFTWRDIHPFLPLVPHRLDTVNLKSFIGKVLLRIKRKFDYNMKLLLYPLLTDEVIITRPGTKLRMKCQLGTNHVRINRVKPVYIYMATKWLSVCVCLHIMQLLLFSTDREIVHYNTVKKFPMFFQCMHGVPIEISIRAATL